MRLESLYLHDNNIDDAGCAALVALAEFRANAVTAAAGGGGKHYSEALKANAVPRMCKLRLTGNDFGGEAEDSLLEVAKAGMFTLVNEDGEEEEFEEEEEEEEEDEEDDDEKRPETEGDSS